MRQSDSVFFLDKSFDSVAVFQEGLVVLGFYLSSINQ